MATRLELTVSSADSELIGYRRDGDDVVVAVEGCADDLRAVKVIFRDVTPKPGRRPRYGEVEPLVNNQAPALLGIGPRPAVLEVSLRDHRQMKVTACHFGPGDFEEDASLP